MGTATVAIRKRTGLSPTGTTVIADITLSASYATGGDTVTPASLGLVAIDAIILSGNSPTSGLVFGVSHGTPTRIKAYQDNATAAAAPLGEVAAATNLTSHTVRAIVYGDLPNI